MHVLVHEVLCLHNIQDAEETLSSSSHEGFVAREHYVTSLPPRPWASLGRHGGGMCACSLSCCLLSLPTLLYLSSSFPPSPPFITPPLLTLPILIFSSLPSLYYSTTLSQPYPSSSSPPYPPFITPPLSPNSTHLIFPSLPSLYYSTTLSQPYPSDLPLPTLPLLLHHSLPTLPSLHYSTTFSLLYPSSSSPPYLPSFLPSSRHILPLFSLLSAL